MARIVLFYLISGCLLTLYGREVSPALAGLSNLVSLADWFVAIGLMLPFRILLTKWNRNRLHLSLMSKEKSFLVIPFSEFQFDVIAWIFNGFLVVGFMAAWSTITWQTGLEVILACIIAGLLVGILNFLYAERDLIDYLREHEIVVSSMPKELLFSITRKFAIMVASVITFSVMIIGFMLHDDVRFLVENRTHLTVESFHEIFYELAIVTAIMLVYSFAVLRRFSGNVDILFGLQILTMKRLANGMCDSRVPIVSGDEFGIIAAHTNDMILKLAERDLIHETLGRYVTKEIRDLILSGRIPLEGETRNVTIMFCDIRRFSSYVESRPPREVVKRLNQYFTEMSRAIEVHKGLVLQFIGDEIEAVFGAPLHLENHAENAVNAALEMRKRLSDLNHTWKGSGVGNWKHGIGIHTGDVLAGNIGSPERMSYLMVGDAVNLAARIQELTKEFGCDILVSGATRGCLADDYILEYAGKFPVRGREQATELYKIP